MFRKRMNRNYNGETFTNELHTAVGSSSFMLSELLDNSIGSTMGHDFFSKEDLVITDGVDTLVINEDYILEEENTFLTEKVSNFLGTTKTIYKRIQIIKANYQTGNLYFSGKYYADDLTSDDLNSITRYIVDVTSDYTIPDNIPYLTYNCSAGVNITLPDATSNKNLSIIILTPYNTDYDDRVKISTYSTQTINGLPFIDSYQYTQKKCFELISDGANWICKNSVYNYYLASQKVGTWDSVNIGPGIGTVNLRAITWSKDLELFVTVGDTLHYKSSDGVTFTNIAGLGATYLQDVIWCSELGIFVAVKQDAVSYSSDATTWNSASTPVAGQWLSVTWSPELGLLCAVGQEAGSGNNKVMTSPDGNIWTNRSISEISGLNGVCWSPELNLFVAIGQSGSYRIATSADGITWSNISYSSNILRDVTWSGELGLFVAVGLNVILTSSNGNTWSTVSGITENYYSVFWSSELQIFVVVGNDIISWSYNGTDWNDEAAPVVRTWFDVTWSPKVSKFLAVTGVSANTVRSMSSI